MYNCKQQRSNLKRLKTWLGKVLHSPYLDFAPTYYHLSQSLQNHLDGRVLKIHEVETTFSMFFSTRLEYRMVLITINLMEVIDNDEIC